MKAKVKAGKMVHKIMVLATKPEDLSSILESTYKSCRMTESEGRIETQRQSLSQHSVSPKQRVTLTHIEILDTVRVARATGTTQTRPNSLPH